MYTTTGYYIDLSYELTAGMSDVEYFEIIELEGEILIERDDVEAVAEDLYYF